MTSSSVEEDRLLDEAEETDVGGVTLLIEETEDLPLPDELTATTVLPTTTGSDRRIRNPVSNQTDEKPGLFQRLGYEPGDMAKEIKKVVKMSLPILAAYLLQFSLNLTILIVIGPLGKTYTAAAALGTMFCNVTGMSLGIGMATAMDTLCSQAATSNTYHPIIISGGGGEDAHHHTPGQNKKRGNPLVGIILQRGIIIQILLALPIFVLWSFSETILVALGQDPHLSLLASLLIKWMMPGLIPYFIFESMKKYLQAQGYMSSTLFVLAIAAPINVILTYLLVWVEPFNLGYIGAPIATSITYFILPLLTLIYMRLFGGLECWHGWTLACIQSGWLEFLKLGSAGIVMLCSEWWAFEICALVAGLLGETALAGQTIVLQTSSLFYMVPMGISISASNRIGNWLGGNFPGRARLSSHCCMIVAWFFATTNAALLLSLRFVWGRMFTQDELVLKLVSDILPVAALFQFADGTAGVCNGILRGCGRQKVGAVINLSGYYLIGLPIGIPLTLCFRETIGVLGLWIGLCIALCLVGVVQLVVLSRTDWRHQVETGRVLLKNSE